MATIKSYTDLEQSKKLAEILPLESADMIWATDNDIIVVPYDMATRENVLHDFIPCWSLAALVNIIPFVTLMKDEEGWYGECKSGKIVAWKTELVDVCVVMIEKLHELNLL